MRPETWPEFANRRLFAAANERRPERAQRRGSRRLVAVARGACRNDARSANRRVEPPRRRARQLLTQRLTSPVENHEKSTGPGRGAPHRRRHPADWPGFARHPAAGARRPRSLFDSGDRCHGRRLLPWLHPGLLKRWRARAASGSRACFCGDDCTGFGDATRARSPCHAMDVACLSCVDRILCRRPVRHHRKLVERTRNEPEPRDRLFDLRHDYPDDDVSGPNDDAAL